MEFERHKKPVRPITMVPLINVVFLLLIFFLVAGTVEKVEVIDVELPEARSGEVIEEGPIQILMGHYNEIIVNDEIIAMEAITEWLKARLKNNPNRVVTVKADARMPAARLIEMLDRLKASGAKQISLTTQEV